MRTSRVVIDEESGVGEARRVAADLARQAGLEDRDAGRLGIIVTELGRNLVKHARHGELLFDIIGDGQNSGIAVLVIDTGPGLGDVAACLRDGYSTAGTPGTGLGAAQRQADAFEIVSWPERGCAILARVFRSGHSASVDRPRWGALCVALPGEEVSGDAVDLFDHNGICVALVADGLGHGPEAAKAAAEAVRLFRKHAGAEPVEVVTAIHAGLRHTRGAAIAVAHMDTTRNRVVYCGLGNISGAVLRPDGVQRMVSQNGTAGHSGRVVRGFEYALPPHSQVIMHSDGIGTSWALDRYPGLARNDPLLVAGILYRDFKRPRDDASVLVYSGDRR